MIIFDALSNPSNYLEVFQKKSLILLFKSLFISFVVAFSSTLLGSFFAYVLTKTDLMFKNILKATLLIPLFLSPYILTLSWVEYFSKFENGKSFIFSIWGVIFIFVLIFTPLSMLIISTGLTNINSKLEDAGVMITTYKNVILKIILPLVKPSLISSFILVFILSLSEFSVPAFLSVNVLTTEIFTQFSAFYNYELAIINSIILIMISISLLMMDKFYISSASFITIGVKSQNLKTTKLNYLQYPIFLIVAFYIYFSTLLPTSILIKETTPDTLYEAFIILKPTIYNSLLYSSIASFILVVFGFIFAYMSQRDKITAIDTILLITFTIPSTVLGIALIKFFNTPQLNFIYSSFWIIIIAYLGKFIFITQKLIQSSIKQLPLSLEESAMIVGANFFTKIRKIVLPIISSSLISAFLISFIFTLGELGSTLLVYPAGTSLLPIKIYTIMANAPQALVSSMALIILLITTFVIGLLFLINRMFKCK